MASNEIFYTSDDPQIALISLANWPANPEIFVKIIMTRHKTGSLPVLDGRPIISTSTFKSITTNNDKLDLMRRLIIKCVLRLFPNVFYCNELVVWDLPPEIKVKSLTDKIVRKLSNNPIFKILPSQKAEETVEWSAEESVDWPAEESVDWPTEELADCSNEEIEDTADSPPEGNLDHPDYPIFFIIVDNKKDECYDLYLSAMVYFFNSNYVKWCFKTCDDKFSFKLERMAYDLIARICMKNVLFKPKNKFLYFNRKMYRYSISDIDNIIDLYDRKTFFNIIMLIETWKMGNFRNRYLRRIQTLNLPERMFKELKSYCPTNRDIDFIRLTSDFPRATGFGL